MPHRGRAGISAQYGCWCNGDVAPTSQLHCFEGLVIAYSRGPQQAIDTYIHEREDALSMRFSLASLSSALLVTCVLLLVIGLSIFTRNLVKKDAAYESLCPWWLRLFLYCTSFALVPPTGLLTGLAVCAFGKNRELRRFAKGAVLASLTSLSFIVAVSLDPNSARTDCHFVFPQAAQTRK